MNHAHDAGLTAVARVRGVRETDSRLGLSTALAETRAAQAEVDALRLRMAGANTFQAGSAGEFLALRTSLEVLGDRLVAAEQARDAARLISDAAHDRWQHDKSRLSAVESLLDRRAAARRAEVARAEARELDDIAAQRWLRDREEATR